jgi:hypothetical protein
MELRYFPTQSPRGGKKKKKRERERERERRKKKKKRKEKALVRYWYKFKNSVAEQIGLLHSLPLTNSSLSFLIAVE